jgi:2,4-dienoyl-CoA reductase-like NADH-dependent reductase (Old Yellow Enzyme family)/thioredoxin reductase
VNGSIGYKQIRVDADCYIAGLAELAQAIKDNGAVACLQIHHGGRFAKVPAPVSASDVGFSLPNGLEVTPRAMTNEEVKSTIDAFVQAAVRAQIAGFNMVELHGATGYLLAQFVSPRTNKRTDEYGGSLENRMRFPLEILRGVKSAVGPRFPVGYRFLADDLLPDGFKVDEAKVFARKLEENGIAYLSVTAGTHESFFIGDGFFAMRSPKGGTVALTEAIKKEVKVPVFANGRISNPQFAEEILSSGKADAIAMARPLLKDPDFPKKAKEGRVDEISECISCGGCLDQNIMNISSTCDFEPMVERWEEPPLGKAEKSKKVFVIGGGPAGMIAAATASQRGHSVRLYEKKDFLGGKLRIAMLPPGKADISKIIAYMENKLKKTDVDIKLNTEFGPEDLKDNPDVVIIAGGSIPARIEVPGIDGDNVFSAEEVLTEKVELGQKVVVIAGGSEGAETAEFLVAKGKEVALVEQLDQIAIDMSPSNRPLIIQKLYGSGVNIILNNKLKAITKDSAIFEDNSGKETEVHGESFVMAIGYVPNHDFFHRIRGMVNEVYIIGDAYLPRKAKDAIREGFQIGINI